MVRFQESAGAGQDRSRFAAACDLPNRGPRGVQVLEDGVGEDEVE